MQGQLTGLRPTRRQCLIFLLYLVLAAIAFAKVSDVERRTGMIRAVPLAILYTPWLLGMLLVVLDRPGPVRNWLAPLVLSFFYPVLAVWYAWSAVSAWYRTGAPVAWYMVVPLGGLVLGGYAAFLVRMCPRRCPECERRSLIPLLRLIKQERRSAKTFWCATCGAKLWKDPEGRWRKERRRTWLDAEESSQSAPCEPGVEPA